jgi:hypothetical protein
VEDDHVDRPGVEERQRLKLTGTNSSIGLIVLIPYAHLTKSDGWHNKTSEKLREATTAPLPTSLRAPSLKSFSNNVRFADLVVMAERLHPIPFRTRP